MNTSNKDREILTTMPPPDTTVQSETLETIARHIVSEWADAYQVDCAGPGTLARLGTEILSALRNERETCAKLLDVRVVEISKYQTRPYRVARRELEAAARAIREGR